MFSFCFCYFFFWFYLLNVRLRSHTWPCWQFERVCGWFLVVRYCSLIYTIIYHWHGLIGQKWSMYMLHSTFYILHMVTIFLFFCVRSQPSCGVRCNQTRKRWEDICTQENSVGKGNFPSVSVSFTVTVQFCIHFLWETQNGLVYM